MKTNPTVLLLLLALIGTSCLGGIGWVGFLSSLHSLKTYQRNDVTVPVVLVAHDLPDGTVLNDPDTQLTIKPHLPDTVPPGAVSNIEDLRGRRLGRSLRKGAACTVNDLAREAAPITRIEPGTRAVTVRIAESAASGFIVPGSQVDLAATMPDPDDASRKQTLVVARNVTVLAVDVVKGGGTRLTVALKPEDVPAVVKTKDQELTAILLRPKSAD